MKGVQVNLRAHKGTLRQSNGLASQDTPDYGPPPGPTSTCCCWPVWYAWKRRALDVWRVT